MNFFSPPSFSCLRSLAVYLHRASRAVILIKKKKKTPQRQRGGSSWETGSGEFHDPTSNPGTFLLPAPLSSPHLFPRSHASVSAFISSADDQKSEPRIRTPITGEAARAHNTAQYPSTLQELERMPTGANLLVGENSYEDLPPSVKKPGEKKIQAGLKRRNWLLTQTSRSMGLNRCCE